MMRRTPRHTLLWRRHAAVVGSLIIAVTSLSVPAHAATRDNTDSQTHGAIRATAFGYLSELQRIADNHNGIRAVGTPGEVASEKLVRQRLTESGYRVTAQDVPYTRFAVGNESTRMWGTHPLRLTTLLMDQSPAFPLARIAARVATAARGTTGCSPRDYAGQDVRTAVVVIARGPCGYATQLSAAADAGAAAVLLYIKTPSPQNVYRLHWFESTPPPIPLASISEDKAQRLLDRARIREVTLRLRWSGHDVHGITHNLIAETAGGDASHTIIAGAHLDSVTEGPGINDNGSSAAALLATAQRLAPRQHSVDHKVRFIWWGAEELVDVGSAYYVDHLTARQRGAISVYVNAEMIASPNGLPFVMHGPGVLSGPFETYYLQHGIPFENTTSDTVSSDQQPFYAAGIPVAGIFNGAMGIKSAAEARVFGGRAGQMYDPCYHQKCDRLQNINVPALRQNTNALAYAIDAFSTTHNKARR